MTKYMKTTADRLYDGIMHKLFLFERDGGNLDNVCVVINGHAYNWLMSSRYVYLFDTIVNPKTISGVDMRIDEGQHENIKIEER